jgi:hypothetical protein
MAVTAASVDNAIDTGIGVSADKNRGMRGRLANGGRRLQELKSNHPRNYGEGADRKNSSHIENDFRSGIFIPGRRGNFFGRFAVSTYERHGVREEGTACQD